MFSAPAAPAPTAMHSTATTAVRGCIEAPEQTIPVRPVKTTKDITRGLSKAR